MNAIHTVHTPEAVQAITHPIRAQVLSVLREPATAAIVAREIGLPRQKVNYHVKALLNAGLVKHAGERRKGNFMEQLYQAVARRFVISPTAAWDRDKLTKTLREQTALANLSRIGESMQHDAAVLLDMAADQDVEVPSVAIETELSFADQADRGQFMQEYMAAIAPLMKKWSSPAGDAYRMTLAIYPETNNKGAEE